MKEYFYLVNDQQLGPVKKDDLKKKNIKKDTYVWAEGMADWKPAGELPELKDIFKVVPPPPPKRPAPPPPPVDKAVPPPKPPQPATPQPPPPQAPQPNASGPQYNTQPPPANNPPPNPNYQPPNYQTQPPQYQYQQTQPGYGPVKNKPMGMIIAGYIFAVLGGLIGFILGVYLWQGKENVNGVKQKKYDEATRKQGMIIAIIAVVAFIVWTSVI